MSKSLTFKAAVALLRHTPLYDARTERLIECVEQDSSPDPTDELCVAMENYAHHMSAEVLAKELAPLFNHYGLLPSPEETLIKVLAEVRAERRRQFDKWGVQNHPSFDDDRDLALAKHNERLMKTVVETGVQTGKLLFSDIFLEEVAEALAAENEDELRIELIQAAAAAIAWVEAIDRRRWRR